MIKANLFNHANVLIKPYSYDNANHAIKIASEDYYYNDFIYYYYYYKQYYYNIVVFETVLEIRHSPGVSAFREAVL